MKLIIFNIEGLPILKTEDLSVIREELVPFNVQTETQEFSSIDEAVHFFQDKHSFESFDLVEMNNSTHNKQDIRTKFLNEHTHSEFEMRYFLQGVGLFYLHYANCVYGLLCEKNDLISVPENTLHWFDCGEHPDFQALRLFTRKDGWVAQFTNSGISKKFPSLEQVIYQFQSFHH